MDAKITKKRLNILLSYDWIKIILTAVAVILVWSLLFTMTATRVTQAQAFTIFNYTGTSASSRFSAYADLAGNGKVFSYDILEVTPTDITISSEYSETLLQTRISTGEGDALFAANVNEGVETEYSRPDGTTFHPTYLEQFLYGYVSFAENLGNGDGTGGYFEDMAEYLNVYYRGDYAAGVADEEKIEADFLDRIDRLNDKRFKTSAEKRAGFEQEKERLEGTAAGADFFPRLSGQRLCRVAADDALPPGRLGNAVERTGYFSINLCPNEDTMGNLKNDVYYTRTVTNEETGTETRVSTAEDVCLVLLNLAEDRYKYARFEGLRFVNYLIETYCTELQEA